MTTKHKWDLVNILNCIVSLVNFFSIRFSIIAVMCIVIANVWLYKFIKYKWWRVNE